MTHRLTQFHFAVNGRFGEITSPTVGTSPVNHLTTCGEFENYARGKFGKGVTCSLFTKNTQKTKKKIQSRFISKRAEVLWLTFGVMNHFNGTLFRWNSSVWPLLYV